MDVIGLDLNNKCMPNEINVVGVYVDICIYVYVIGVLCDPGLARGFRYVEC